MFMAVNISDYFNWLKIYEMTCKRTLQFSVQIVQSCLSCHSLKRLNVCILLHLKCRTQNLSKNVKTLVYHVLVNDQNCCLGCWEYMWTTDQGLDKYSSTWAFSPVMTLLFIKREEKQPLPVLGYSWVIETCI